MDECLCPFCLCWWPECSFSRLSQEVFPCGTEACSDCWDRITDELYDADKHERVYEPHPV